MASNVYHEGWNKIMDGTIALETDDIRVTLVNSSYSYSAAHDYLDDCSAGEFTSGTVTNFVRKALTTEAVAIDGVYIKFTADNVTWTSLGNANNDTAVAAVVYKYNVADSAAELIAYIDFGDKLTDGNDFTLTWNTNGIIRIDNTQAT